MLNGTVGRWDMGRFFVRNVLLYKLKVLSLQLKYLIVLQIWQQQLSENLPHSDSGQTC